MDNRGVERLESRVVEGILVQVLEGMLGLSGILSIRDKVADNHQTTGHTDKP